MGRRANIKHIAHGLLHGFMSRNNSAGGYWAIGKLYLLVVREGENSLTIDLWNGTSSEPLAPEVAEVRAHYASWLRRALRHHAMPPETLAHAEVRLEFERSDLRAIALARGYPDDPPFLCRVCLFDDRSREYAAQAVGACHPHNPIRESRSGG